MMMMTRTRTRTRRKTKKKRSRLLGKFYLLMLLRQCADPYPFYPALSGKPGLSQLKRATQPRLPRRSNCCASEASPFIEPYLSSRFYRAVPVCRALNANPSSRIYPSYKIRKDMLPEALVVTRCHSQLCLGLPPAAKGSWIQARPL